MRKPFWRLIIQTRGSKYLNKGCSRGNGEEGMTGKRDVKAFNVCFISEMRNAVVCTTTIEQGFIPYNSCM